MTARPRRECRRRDVLGAVSASVIALSGCLSQDVPTDADDSENTSDESIELVIEQSTIETTDSDCAGPDDETIDITQTGDSIVVTGTIIAPNPCHEAILETVAIEDDGLSILVDVRSTLEANEECIQCVGGISYNATVVVNDGDALEAIHVDHIDGEEHTKE